MKLLAIETTGPVSSVALFEDGIITEIKNEDSYSHLKELMPMVKQLLDDEEINPRDLDAICISKGPGSFTGIRIGMASAKGLAQVWDKPIVEVPTLAGFAFRDYDWFEDDRKLLFVPIIDAKMHQVYAAAYEKDNREPVIAEGVYNLDEFLESLTGAASGYDAVVYFADAEKTFSERLSQCEFEYAFAPFEDSFQTACGTARLGAELFENKACIKSCYDAQPEYFRLPEAERKLKEKQEAKK